MKIVFAGTPEFSIPALRVLLDGSHAVAAVYTQPDRPAGRGRKMCASPVKQLAAQNGLPVLQPLTLKDPHAQAELAGFGPDLMVVVAYGLILPRSVLNIPRRGCVNLHASLLPRWRGAAPIQRAILAGDAETGVSLMQMEEGLDTGPVLAMTRCAISPHDTGGALHDRLARLGADLLGMNLESLLEGSLEGRPQDERRATYARKIDKSEATLDWFEPAESLRRRVRAFDPWPVAQTAYNGRVLRIWDAVVLSVEGHGHIPGTVLAAGADGIDVACGEGTLRVRIVQLPGGRRISAADFINANSLNGICFGSS
jgi:methionyl-tRNA formyltransferase